MEPKGMMGLQPAHPVRQAIHTSVSHVSLRAGRPQTPIVAVAQQPEENFLEYSNNTPGSNRPNVVCPSIFTNSHAA